LNVSRDTEVFPDQQALALGLIELVYIVGYSIYEPLIGERKVLAIARQLEPEQKPFSNVVREAPTNRSPSNCGPSPLPFTKSTKEWCLKLENLLSGSLRISAPSALELPLTQRTPR
jgi:hypothetical protein